MNQLYKDTAALVNARAKAGFEVLGFYIIIIYTFLIKYYFIHAISGIFFVPLTIDSCDFC
jgi:hypothetical protein